MKFPRRLTPRSHSVFRLAPDLLLVFKPTGHREPQHRHPHRQRLRILRGTLEVRTAHKTIVLRPTSRLFTLAANRQHTTVAREDTWLIAEALPGPKARAPSRSHGNVR